MEGMCLLPCGWGSICQWQSSSITRVGFGHLHTEPNTVWLQWFRNKRFPVWEAPLWPLSYVQIAPLFLLPLGGVQSL